MFSGTTEADKQTYFGDMAGDTEGQDFIIVTDQHDMSYIIHKLLGKFKSQTEARKNGWNKEIPLGYKEWKFGKFLKFHTYKAIEVVL